MCYKNGLPGLRQRREAKGLTRKELGGLVSLAPNTIQAYEDGNRSPQTQVVYRLAAILDCLPGDLVNEPSQSSPSEVSNA